MTVLANRTPYGLGLGYGRDLDGRPALFVSVKATFTWDHSGKVALCAAVPLRTSDEIVGEGVRASILRAAEIGPRKPRVDVLLAGALVMPAAVEQTDAALFVGSQIRKAVRVVGPRRWIPGLVRDRVPSKPRPFTRVPIDWRLAFGGADVKNMRFHDPRNPAGCGLSENLTDYDDMAVPLFEDPEAPIVGWRSRPKPQGFGPVAPYWLPRAKLAGTYDAQWQSERAPLPPGDFDWGFYNLAPEDQQLSFYGPGEQVRLRSMTVHGHDHFVLPEFDVPVIVATEEALLDSRAIVDTIIIEPEELRFSLIGRATCPLGDSPVVYEVAVGSITRGHRHALETGKRYLSPSRLGAQQ